MGVILPDPVELRDVPVWAEEYAANIVGARILTEAAPLYENITRAEAERLVQRVHGILVTSIRDDFYAVINKQFIEEAVIKPGYTYESCFSEITRKVDEDLRALVDDILSGEHEKKPPGKK